MKKTITILLCTCLILTNGYGQKTDQPYDYPVKPGSSQWQAFKSIQDMYDACQIPIQVLNQLSTKALIQTCLNYPAMAVLLVQNTPQQGFDTWRQHFNGIEALYKRADVLEELLSVYSNYDLSGHQQLATAVAKGGYTFVLRVLENILVQKDLITRLSDGQQKQLIKTCLTHYALMEADTVYGFAALASAGRVIAAIGTLRPGGKLKASVQATGAEEFVKTGMLASRETLSAIIAEAKKDN
jgi:hypothetical protein